MFGLDFITHSIMLGTLLINYHHAALKEQRVCRGVERPLTISSWHGNNFGVAVELGGSYCLESEKLVISAKTLRLRQVTDTHYGYASVKTVRVELFRGNDAGTFSSYASSEPIAVNKTFDNSGIIRLAPQQLTIELAPETPLTTLWPGIEVNDPEGSSWYAHTPRNFFSREFGAMGWGSGGCDKVDTAEAAIENHCHAQLAQALEQGARSDAAPTSTAPPDLVALARAENDVEAIYVLHAHGIEIDSADNQGTTPLMLAAANGATKMVEALLNSGANPNYATPNGPQAGRSAVNSAVAANSPETLQLLLERGGRADRPDAYGWLPLHYAVYYEKMDSVEVLLKHGAPVDAQAPGQRGETPLMVAAQNGKIAAIRLLLSRGASGEAVDRHGKTALDYALFFKQAEAAALLR